MEPNIRLELTMLSTLAAVFTEVNNVSNELERWRLGERHTIDTQGVTGVVRKSSCPKQRRDRCSRTPHNTH